jgi:hypothetical protein
MARKIKKALKNVAKVAIPALAIAGMMRGKKGRGFTNADARKLMTSNAAMRNSMMQNPMVTAEDLIKLNEGTDFGLGPLDMKKGGRVKKTKFSTKKKKQANKMRKK